MFCPNCGANVEGSAYCPNCGTPMQANAPEAQPSAPNYQDPNGTYPPNGAYPQNGAYPNYNMAPPLSMKWFKFLIFFALFAGAVLNLFSGISLLTGSVYGNDAKLVYGVFKDLKSVDMIFGALMIAMAVFAVFTRFRLSGYYKNGPMMLVAVYAFGLLVNVGYMIAIHSVLPEAVTKEIDISSTISSAVTSAAMIAINFNYFKKRSHLFVK